MKLAEFLERVGAEESGDGYLGHCPSHADSKPSLRVAVADTGKVLVKCRAGCNTADVMAAVGARLGDLASMAADDVPVQRVRSGEVPASAQSLAELRDRLDGYMAALSPESVAYVSRRFGVTEEDAQRLELGTAHDLGGGERVVIPFLDPSGIARGFQARALDGNARVRWIGPPKPPGESWAKIGFLRGASGWDEVVITEGPGDALTAVGLGYDAILVAGASHAGNAAIVSEIAAWVGDRVAVVAGDGDPAGRGFSAALAESLADRRILTKVVDVPEGLDLSKWFETAGREPIIAAIRAAQWVDTLSAAVRQRDESRYPLSDLGNAKFVRDFIEAKGSAVRYAPETGFYLYLDGAWVLDTLDKVRAYTQEASGKVREIANRLAEDAGADTDKQKIAGRWRAWARHSESTRGIDSAIRELQALDGVPAELEEFDKRHDLLCVRNGVVDLRTGELLPHDRRLLLTRRVNVDYRPDAKAHRWRRFLTEVFPDHPDLPAYMQRLVGYGITGYTDEQCFAVLHGKGANGKSVLTETLTAIFGAITTTTPFSTFEAKPSGGIPNDIAALNGARLVMASEGEQGKPMAEAVLKRITGRDRITARFMRKEFFTFSPSFLIMLATNHKPKFYGQDEGLWRRVKLIPFDRWFAPHERDPKLADKLIKEAEGILAWAVAGAVEWFAHGLQDPETVRDATKGYRETSDALRGFIPGWFEVTGNAADVVSAKAVWTDYQTWTADEGLSDRERWRRSTLMEAVQERGAVLRVKNNQQVITGIRRATDRTS